MKGFGISDRGAVRSENQDSFCVKLMPERNSAVLVLCDGMGGAQAGSVASSMAVEAFMSHAESCFDYSECPSDMDQDIVDAVNFANIKVYDRSFSDFGCTGMGTTLVGIFLRDDRVLVVNVGDSRCYHLTGRGVERVTRDHSLVEELLDKGIISSEEARNHPRKNIITRALGVEQSVLSDVFQVDLRAGEMLLLCSDGLSNQVEDEEILRAFQTLPDPASVCRSLLDLALQRGAPDNVTVCALLR